MNLLDKARNLIRLADYIPAVEIPITFIGVRPWEKPHEELVGEDKRLEPSGVEKILRVHLACLPQLAFLTQAISEIERLAIAEKPKEVKELLCEAVPTFQPIQPAGMATAANSSERTPLVPQRHGWPHLRGRSRPENSGSNRGGKSYGANTHNDVFQLCAQKSAGAVGVCTSSSWLWISPDESNPDAGECHKPSHHSGGRPN